MAAAAPPSNVADASSQWKKNLSVHVICPECKEVPPKLEFPGSHETVCGSCGLVLADREIDMHSEWRTFSNDDQNNDDPSRVGEAMNPLLNGDQLETQIASGGSGRVRDLYRAQNKQSNEKANKALLAAYKEIGALCDGFTIPKFIADTAKLFFKQVDDAKALRGKSQDAVIASCIFLACRHHSAGRSFNEIFALTKVSRKEIGRTFKALERFLKMQDIKRKNEIVSSGGVPDPNDTYTATASTKPSDLCNRFCNFLDLPFQVASVCIDLSDRVTNDGRLAGKSPLTIASACIYMASHLMGHGKTAKEIAAVSGVSDGTIRGAYKPMYAAREELLDPEWMKKIKGDIKNLPAS